MLKTAGSVRASTSFRTGISLAGKKRDEK